MTDPYRVPKREISAEVVLRGQPPLEVKLFLSQAAQSHDGFERLSDLLNGDKPFIPASDEEGKLTFLHRDALEMVTVKAEHEFGGDVLMAAALSSDQATVRRVEITLSDGTTLKGNISYLMPEGRKRLQDYLNEGDPFIPLREGDRLRFVNKSGILKLSTD